MKEKVSARNSREVRAAQPQDTFRESGEERVKYISVVCCLLDFVAELEPRHVICSSASDWLSSWILRYHLLIRSRMWNEHYTVSDVN